MAAILPDISPNKHQVKISISATTEARSTKVQLNVVNTFSKNPFNHLIIVHCTSGALSSSIIQHRAKEASKSTAPSSGCQMFIYASLMSVHLHQLSQVYLCESWLVSNPGNVSSVSELSEPPVKSDRERVISEMRVLLIQHKENVVVWSFCLIHMNYQTRVNPSRKTFHLKCIDENQSFDYKLSTSVTSFKIIVI